MSKYFFLLIYFISLSNVSFAERELGHSDWDGLYLPDYMINDKEYPELTMSHSFESYVLIVSYKDKLIIKAKVFAGNPKNIRVSEFEGEIINPKLKKQIIKNEDVNVKKNNKIPQKKSPIGDFKCKYCSKSYSRKDNLKRHIVKCKMKDFDKHRGEILNLQDTLHVERELYVNTLDKIQTRLGEVENLYKTLRN